MFLAASLLTQRSKGPCGLSRLTVPQAEMHWPHCVQANIQRLTLRGLRRIGHTASQALPWPLRQPAQSVRRLRSKPTTIAFLLHHPREALEDADGAAVTAEQVAGEEEFEGQHRGRGAQENHLAAVEREVEQAVVDLKRRHQVGQADDGPGEGEAEATGTTSEPVARVARGRRAVRLPRRGLVLVPQRMLAGGEEHQPVDRFDHRKVRAQPAAVEAAPLPGDADDQRRRRRAVAKTGTKRG